VLGRRVQVKRRPQPFRAGVQVDQPHNADLVSDRIPPAVQVGARLAFVT
jgi:hypothetical protein